MQLDRQGQITSFANDPTWPLNFDDMAENRELRFSAAGPAKRSIDPKSTTP